MAFVATLITHPSNPIITSALAMEIADAVSGGSPDWLCAGIACDIALPDDGKLPDFEKILGQYASDNKFDYAVQSMSNRRKKMLIADMDSTMIEQECIDELAAEVGLKDKVSAITARAMNGEIEFEAALRERVGLLKGLPIDVVDSVIEKRITFMSGGHQLIATMKKHGAYCALVSGGFTVFTGPIAQDIGFDDNRANILIEKDGVLTGEVAEPILGKQAKVDALNEITQKLSLTPSDAIAVGDGANDLGMLQLAGSGVALHAKPSVAAQAKIKINNGDLTALLYLQGYRQEDFAT